MTQPGPRSLAKPTPGPDLALFPAHEDAGTRQTIAVPAIRSLIAWAEHYGLDAWAGHVCYMYGKPYITERGAVALCDRSEKYRGFSCGHLIDREKKALGFGHTDIVWECAVSWRDRDHPVVEYGVVTQAELDALLRHTIDNLKRSRDSAGRSDGELEAMAREKLLYVPLFSRPNQQARVRALRRAHLMACPTLQISVTTDQINLEEVRISEQAGAEYHQAGGRDAAGAAQGVHPDAEAAGAGSAGGPAVAVDGPTEGGRAETLPGERPAPATPRGGGGEPPRHNGGLPRGDPASRPGGEGTRRGSQLL